MESYEKEWLAGQPVLLAILHCVGLFDRPASGDCLEALRASLRLRSRPARLSNLAKIRGGEELRVCAALSGRRANPAIPGLTDALIDLSDDQWRRAVARLRETRLLSPPDLADPEALDAHPLVREWFGERLGRPTSRRGRRRTAASMTICATRRAKAKRRRLPTSGPSFTPSLTAAGRGGSKRRSLKSTIASVAGFQTGK